MRFLGIDFVPLNTSIDDRLETLASGLTLFLFLGLIPVGIWTTIYVLFYTNYWYLAIAYLFWIWVIDTETPGTGGRPSEWLRRSGIFKYAAKYYPVTLTSVSGLELDPNRNYLSCVFPHGVMPFGVILALQTNGCGALDLYPIHRSNGLTLKANFYIPIYRDVLLALGMCNATSKSIDWILSNPRGGRIAGLTVGGAAEAAHCHGGQYRIKLKDRKGFIKSALRNGSTIIPTFAFGQTDSYKQYVPPEGSFLKRMQTRLKQLTGVSFVLVYGRGFFQYTFGFLPLQKPINVVCGKLFEVNKIENPTQEIIDHTHEKFIVHLKELFEEHKYQALENPENSILEIF